jgi:hypothetical protein
LPGWPEREGEGELQQGPTTIANDPVLFAYSPLEARNGKTRWRCLGAAWPHDTGAGLTVQLDLVPIQWDGRDATGHQAANEAR